MQGAVQTVRRCGRGQLPGGFEVDEAGEGR